MPIIDNKALYEKIKSQADLIYSKPSAYKSGWIVNRYKKLGGSYTNDNKPKELKRWFDEEWGDIGGKEYPVYRPYKRVNSATPLTASEIDPTQAKKQIELKQVLKGEANLPPFQMKGGSLTDYSNPTEVYNRLKEYAPELELYISDKKDKKYFIIHPKTKAKVYFGQMGYEDFTKHKDPIRRANYLRRSASIKGDWKRDKFSPNNLARNILW